MARLCLLTLEDRTGFVIDDALAIEELRARGHEVDEVPWSRPGVEWSRYALVVVRTPWDYTLRPDAFLQVLARIEAQAPLENPRPVIEWNLRKTYLRDLEARGVRVVPTTWGRGAEALLALRPSSPIVVKPIVGANARDTFVIDGRTSDAELARVAALYREREWMVQPFVRSVIEEGEHSLVYFGGVFSHAIVKTPKAGDFRVQEEHGGTIRATEPPPDVRAAADRVIALLSPGLLQARIDLVRLEDGTPALMEAELIEPSLYFRMHEGAPASFADALERRLGA